MLVKVLVKVMEGAAVFPDAIKTLHDQPWRNQAPAGSAARPRITTMHGLFFHGRGKRGANSPRRGNPLTEIGTIDCFPNNDWVAVKQVSNPALRL